MIQNYNYAYIARVIIDAEISLKEARLIHQYEVVPAVGFNLAGIAGQWAGFNQAWLISRCSKYMARWQHRLHQFLCYLSTPYINYFTESCWLEIT
ncbi:MAG: hypothetical protein HRU23_00520 [Gammaproteobacteria bacterium]|nr:hypothetical protein [Gammaproteobacteria bacterium]